MSGEEGVMRRYGLTSADAQTVYVAALCDEDELAQQLKRLGISEPEEALDDAIAVRPMLLAEVERVRREALGAEDG